MGSGKKSGGKFRFADFLVILLCLSGAAYSLNLFRLDLFQTLNGQNKTPIGIVSIKRNTVQRRMSDRVIWDRLVKESPVYPNDMIRVGDNSDADLYIGGNNITINENTLLRLRYNKETGEFQIDLTSGSIGLVTDPEGNDVSLNIMGRQVTAKPGTALNAAAGNNGMAVHVSEGAATIPEKKQNRESAGREPAARELGAGAAVTMDSVGSIRSAPAAFVIQPKPNALYRKSGNEPLNIAFSWNRINLQPNETLRLEIAEDEYFSSSVRTFNGLNDSARAGLSAGLWNWRLTYNGIVLDSGHFTITDADSIELLSPARNRQFFYETEAPKLYFQWSQTDDVSYYIVEVDVSPEFRNPIIKRQTTAASFFDSSLKEGIWYWRVTPVFSQTNANSDGVIIPRPSVFRIVKSKEPQTPALTFIEEPAPVLTTAPTPAPAPEPVPALEPAPAPAPESTPAPAPTTAPAPGPTPTSDPAPTPAPVSAPARPLQPKRITLESPSNETTLPGLTALRQQTVFRWSSDEAVAKSRFVLSHNSNPLSGQAVIEITDPNRTIRIDRLEEGIWYWTVEAQTPEGVNITAQTPRQLRVLPIPILPAPSERQPAEGYRIGIEELKEAVIHFRWSAVQGANGYIFTLYQEAGGRRRQITQIGPENRTSWSTDIKALGRGNFIWRMEAVSVGRNNVIEQHGNPTESRFVIDIPQAGPVTIISGPGVKP
jgi:hypothetical protein